MNPLVPTVAGLLLCISIILFPPFTALLWAVFMTWWLFRFDLRIISTSLAILICVTSVFYFEGHTDYVDSMLLNLFILLVIALEIRIADHIRDWRNTRRAHRRQRRAEITIPIGADYSPYILDLREYSQS
ncbi:MAG: hypothetical protein AAB381_02730 [Patescibacteria group bacterium]